MRPCNVAVFLSPWYAWSCNPAAGRLQPGDHWRVTQESPPKRHKRPACSAVVLNTAFRYCFCPFANSTSSKHG